MNTEAIAEEQHLWLKVTTKIKHATKPKSIFHFYFIFLKLIISSGGGYSNHIRVSTLFIVIILMMCLYLGLI
jgi:hypothetical protein